MSTLPSGRFDTTKTLSGPCRQTPGPLIAAARTTELDGVRCNHEERTPEPQLNTTSLYSAQRIIAPAL